MKTFNPALCLQQEIVFSLKIVHKWCSLIDSFPVLSILSILLDKGQIKSFEDINILIKIELFCLKTVFCFWKKLLFEEKKVRKNCCMKQKKFFGKKTFFWKHVYF